ncbi:MAG: DUF1638 domain-containing protein [bacterium]
MSAERVLVIACGALARELVRVRNLNDWDHLDIQCLPAEWHNTPQKIVPAVRRKIAENRAAYRTIFIGYADCGTGGRLDALIEEEGVRRLPGAHCYSFFAGAERFDRLVEAEIGTFYLTDYLAKNFDRLIVEGFGIDRHPELKEMYFANYKKLVYLAQSEDAEIDAKAEQAAAFLNLKYERVHTGDAPFESALRQSVGRVA